MKTLLLTHPLPAQVFADALKAVDPQLPLLEYRPGLDDAELADVEAVLGWRFPAGVAQRLPRLRWVCSIGAGVDKLLVPELPAPVQVSRIVDAEQAEGIAQFVALMALRHARSLPLYEQQQRLKQWTRQPIGALRSRVGVLGMGVMGSAVARLLQAVGFQVSGWSRREAQSLEQVLAGSDIVVCALPLTPQTEGVLDARLMRMTRRLPDQHRPRCAWSGDRSPPCAAAISLARRWTCSSANRCRPTTGVRASPPPHIAAQSSPHTIAAQYVAGLRCLMRGEPPPNPVDRGRGY